MSRQKDRITRKFRKMGMAWAGSSDKYCGANDSFDDQIEGRKTYHVHPDASYPHQNSVMQFDSLKEIEEYLSDRKRALAASEAGDNDTAFRIMSEW